MLVRLSIYNTNFKQSNISNNYVRKWFEKFKHGNFNTKMNVAEDDHHHLYQDLFKETIKCHTLYFLEYLI